MSQPPWRGVTNLIVGPPHVYVSLICQRTSVIGAYMEGREREEGAGGREGGREGASERERRQERGERVRELRSAEVYISMNHASGILKNQFLAVNLWLEQDGTFTFFVLVDPGSEMTN